MARFKSSIWLSPVWRWGRLFLLAFLMIRLVFWGFTFPNPDEAYYWLWGQHPGFSYYDHPPFHAWVQGLLAAPWGGSNWVLRLPNLISNLILAVFFYRICRYLYGGEAVDRFWLVVLLVASSPLFFLFLSYAWHDHWLVTWSVVSSFWFVRFVDGYGQPGQGKSRYKYRDLYGAAFTLGLAGLCKYTAVFVGLGFLATLLGNARLRQLGRDPRLYLAMVILTLTLSPILIWNWQHDFYSFRFYADRSASSSGFTINPLQPIAFLALCALILGPIQSWGIIRLLRQYLARLSAPSHSLEIPGSTHSSIPPFPPPCYPTLALWVFTLSTGAFTLLSLTSVAVYYWNILAYPLLFPLLTEQFYRSKAAGSTALPLVRRRQLVVAQGLGLFTAAALVFHYTVVPFTALAGTDVDPDSAALFGWGEIALAVEAQAATLTHPLLLTTDYRSAAALAYALNKSDVMAISGRIDQFDFWYDSERMAGRDAVLLGESWHSICPTHLEMFARTDPPITLTIRRAGANLQTYQLIRAYGFKAELAGSPLSPEYPLAFTDDGERCN